MTVGIQRGAGRAGRSGGFTLLEVLAAFMVFALSFAVIMQIVGSGVRNTRRASDMTQAALYAQSKLDLLGVEAPIEEGASSGQFNDKYSWELTIEPYRFPDGGPDPEQIPIDLYRVELRVLWDTGAGTTRSADFVTMQSQDRNYNQGAFEG